MINTRLSLCLFLALASGAAFARPVVVPALPPPEFADTEVSTNRPFATNREGSQVLTLRIDFAATPTNNVQIALGRDADGDGELSSAETGVVVGWDCGEWVVRSPAAAEPLRAPAATGDAAKRFVWTLRASNGRARSLAAEENGRALAFAPAGRPPEWTFSPSWDLARFTVRGVGDAAGSFRAELLANGTLVILK